MNDPRNITLSGVPEGYDARAILDEIAKGGQPVVHVARDDKRMVLRARHAGRHLPKLGLPAL